MAHVGKQKQYFFFILKGPFRAISRVKSQKARKPNGSCMTSTLKFCWKKLNIIYLYTCKDLGMIICEKNYILEIGENGVSSTWTDTLSYALRTTL